MLSNKDTTKLGSSVVQELKINQRRILIDSLEIGIPAPEQMIALGERQLPNGVKVGQLLNSKTLNYKKFTPHRDGLFCERIFGPVQSFVCACGKKKESVQSKSRHKDTAKTKPLPPLTGVDMLEITQKKSSLSSKTNVSATVQTEPAFCPKCQVEYISKNVRRHRLGYIKLFAPVTHIWYLKGRPSYLSLFLGKRKKAITSLAYCNAYLVEQACSGLNTQDLLKDTDKSVTALVGKSNIKVWQKCHSNDLNVKNVKLPFLKDFSDWSFSSARTKNRHLQTETGSYNRTDIKNNVNHKNNLYTTQKDFNNQLSFTALDSESFFSLLVQLFPETLTQRFQTSSKGVPERLLSLCAHNLNSDSLITPIPANKSDLQNKAQLGRKQSKICYPFVPTSIFGKQRNRKDLDLKRTANLNDKLVKQKSIQGSKLGTKRLKYKVSTKLEAIKYFVETVLGATNQKFGKGHSISVKRDKINVSRTFYIRAQTLPFLPSLICSFHLRDCLISFLQSLPCKEDIPIPVYCQTPRRYPLRDVHKFLADLRSTSTPNQADKLTSESITKFIGRANQESHKKKAVNQANLIKRLCTNSSMPCKNESVRACKTSFLQRQHLPLQKRTFYAKPEFCKTTKDPLRSWSSAVTPPSKHHNIVVHRVRYPDLFYQNKVDAFMAVNSREKNHSSLVLSREDRVDTTKQLSVIKNTKWGKERAFATTETIKKKPVFTPNGVCISKFVNKSSYNQLRRVSLRCKNSVMLAYLRTCVTCVTCKKFTFCTTKFLYQNFSFCIPSFLYKPCYAKTKVFARISSAFASKQETRRYKSLPKVALLPLDLTFTARSSATRNRFGMLLPSNNKNISGELVFDAKRSIDQLFSPVYSSVDLLTPMQLVSRETKMSLRGVLLKTFFEMIKTELVDLSLRSDLRQFRINDLKQVKLYNQNKQTVTSPNLERFTQNLVTDVQTFYKLNSVSTLDLQNKAQLPDNRSVIDFSDVGNKIKNPLHLSSNQSLPQFDRQLFAKRFNRGFPVEFKKKSFSHLSKQRERIKYKPREFTYTYIPILLYVRQFKFNKNKIGSSQKRTFCMTDVYKKFTFYTKTLVVQKVYFLHTSKLFGVRSLQHKSRRALRLNVSNQTSLQANGSYVSDPMGYTSFSSQNQDENKVTSDLQTFLFRKRIDTYQARLLHVVFGVQVESMPLNQLNRTRSSFLHKNEILVYTQNKALFRAPKLGCTYLLIKDHHKKDESDRTDKNKVDVKPKFWYACLQSKAQLVKKEKFDFVFFKKTRTKGMQAVPPLACVKKVNEQQELQEAGTIKLKCNGVKAFAEFNSTNFGKVQRSLYLQRYALYVRLPEQASFEPGSGFSKSLLYKIDLNRVQVLRTESILTKQGIARVQRNREQSTVTPTSFGSEIISKWHINGAKEILLYTGGGALESLLKRFNTSLFCQFLFGELQTLRKHYKDQIVLEYNKNKTVAGNSFESFRSNKSGNQRVRSVLRKPTFDTVSSLSSSSIASEHTLNYKERDLGLKCVVTDKSASLFCRRIYRTTRRLKIVQLLMRSKRRPEWMMISVLPVLPPDLRPVLQMGDNLIVASDLNTLYQRVIYRNNRHYKGRFLDFHFVSSIHRLVQDAVDRLIENGKGGSTPFLTPGGRPLKSLSDILKGKRGRFRFNLLGKRVDFSGRSVIVVDPNLKIHECGLPKEMALELYKYILIRQLFLQKRVSSIVNAKKVIKQRESFIWDILRQIIYYHPLLLNRAPTLHRLGIQAFQPKLTLGNAILLHPLVCAGFNADFDGDQMGVHLPLSPQARAEAWDLLWSRNNLLSPATGQPILLPSQDMVLGFYYMSSLLPYGTTNKGNTSRFKNEESKTSFSPFNSLVPEREIKKLSTKTGFVTENLVTRPSSALRLSANSTVNNCYSSVVSNKKHKNQIDGVVIHVFSDQFQVLFAYQKKQIEIHTPIWYKWVGKSENGEKSQTPLELRINTFGDRTEIYSTHQFKNKVDKRVNSFSFSSHIRTTVGRVLINNLIAQNN